MKVASNKPPRDINSLGKAASNQDGVRRTKNKTHEQLKRYVFDASPGNQARIAALVRILADKTISIMPEKVAFISAMADVALKNMSVSEACDRYALVPQVFARVLAGVSARTPAETYRRISRLHLKELCVISQTTTQPAVAAAPLSRQASPALQQPPASTSPARPLSRQVSQPPGMGIAEEFLFDDIGLLDLSNISTHFDFDAELAALLHFDAFVDLTAGQSAPTPVPTPAFVQQAAPSPVRQATPPQSQSSARSPTPSPIVSSAEAQFAPTPLPIEQVKRAPWPPSAASAQPSLMHSASPGAMAAQHYVQAHPNDGRVVFVTKQMIGDTHKEFLAIARSSGHRVHVHKVSLFHAMIDMCHGVTFNAAAATKFLAPEALLGAMHCLHAASPIDVFQWLKEPSTERSLNPPGAGVVIIIQDLNRPQDAMQLAPHRFDPHAQVYQQHPLHAGQHPMWMGNQVGAQPMPRI